jgi:hypothetical protein
LPKKTNPLNKPKDLSHVLDPVLTASSELWCGTRNEDLSRGARSTESAVKRHPMDISYIIIYLYERPASVPQKKHISPFRAWKRNQKKLKETLKLKKPFCDLTF